MSKVDSGWSWLRRLRRWGGGGVGLCTGKASCWESWGVGLLVWTFLAASANAVADEVRFGVVARPSGNPTGQTTAQVVMRASTASVFGLDLRLTYAPTNAAVAGVELGDCASGMSLITNLSSPGVILAGMAGAYPIGGEGPVVNVIFASGNGVCLSLAQVLVNEGATPSVITTNTPPLLAAPPDQYIDELASFTATNVASDGDIPTNTLTFALIAGPTGMDLDPQTGRLSWTPSEEQGPSTNSVVVKVSDNGMPGLSVTNRFSVIVREIHAPPTILVQPQSQTVNEGDSVTFSVTAQGTTPLAYQWLWNGNPLTGETASALILTNLQAAQAGGYSVVVTNLAGEVSSANASLIVRVATSISWADPADIAYGAALGASQLNAIAVAHGSSIPGAFSYAPAAGTVLAATPGQTLSVVFVPTDTARFLAATGAVHLTVLRAPLTVTAEDASRGYGAANPVFRAKLSGFVNGDTAAVVSGAAGFETPATVSSPVGSYSIVPAAGTLSATNYTFGPFVNGTLTVTPANLTVTAEGASRGYGAANPVFRASFSGFVNGDTVAVVSGAASFETPATVSSPVGGYNIVPAAGTLSATNYTFGPFVNGTLTVTPANLTVTAEDASRGYGAANPAFRANISGFMNGDTVAVVTGAASFETPATVSSPVGGYSIVPAVGTLSAANYTFGPFVNGTLTVTPASLTVAAEDASRGYGAANPAFRANISGFMNGDTVAVVTGAASFETPATVSSPVGGYSIVPAVGTLSAANYTFGPFVNGTLTVTPVSLTVTADNASRGYGAANPAFTGTILGLQNSDNIWATYSCEAGLESPIGSYEIKASLHDPDGKLGNYKVTLNSGYLVVTPVQVVRIADFAMVGGIPSFAITTATGTRYTVEYKDSLEDAVWQIGPTLDGTGEVLTYSDTDTVGRSRYYRLRVQ